jgi:hypothetical protein
MLAIMEILRPLLCTKHMFTFTAIDPKTILPIRIMRLTSFLLVDLFCL